MTPYREVCKDLQTCQRGKSVEDHLFLYEVYSFPFAARHSVILTTFIQIMDIILVNTNTDVFVFMKHCIVYCHILYF
jgi:hypothetical protein